MIQSKRIFLIFISMVFVLVFCILFLIFSSLSYYDKHVLVYKAGDDEEQTDLLNSFSVRDSECVEEVCFMYKRRGNKYALRIITSDVEEFFCDSIDGEVLSGNMPDLTLFIDSSYEIENFENVRQRKYIAFPYKIFGDRKDVYSNILIYPVADSEMFAIEIVIDFPFTDFPESIIDDHWWDDSLLAKFGLIK